VLEEAISFWCFNFHFGMDLVCRGPQEITILMRLWLLSPCFLLLLSYVIVIWCCCDCMVVVVVAAAVVVVAVVAGASVYLAIII
jgi:hypothetical protein